MRKVDTTFISGVSTKFKVTFVNELNIDDVLMMGAKAEGFRRRTGKDVYDEVPNRSIRDYLVRTGLVFA